MTWISIWKGPRSAQDNVIKFRNTKGKQWSRDQNGTRNQCHNVLSFWKEPYCQGRALHPIKWSLWQGKGSFFKGSFTTFNLHDKNLRNYNYLRKQSEYIVHQNNEINQKRKKKMAEETEFKTLTDREARLKQDQWGTKHRTQPVGSGWTTWERRWNWWNTWLHPNVWRRKRRHKHRAWGWINDQYQISTQTKQISNQDNSLL